VSESSYAFANVHVYGGMWERERERVSKAFVSVLHGTLIYKIRRLKATSNKFGIKYGLTKEELSVINKTVQV
jgi:hypothetical protein